MPDSPKIPPPPAEMKSPDAKVPLAKSKGRLFVQVRYGLGNRLNAFISTIIVGELLGVEIEIGWPFLHEECAARFSDLFRRDGLEAVCICDDPEIYPELPKADRYSLDRLKNELQAGQSVRLCGGELFGEGLLEGWQFQERVRERMRSLRLAPDVQKLIQDGRAPSIGMHVRLSDHIPCHIYSPAWCYFEIIQAIGANAPHEKIFICTDTASVATELSARFSQIELAPSLQIGLSRRSLAGVQAALADLWILSRCSLIFASPLSSFARVARLLGGAQRFDVLAFGSAENFRGSYLAWSIQNAFQFDLGQKKHRLNPLAAAKDPLRTRIYFLLGKFFMSGFYRSRAFPTQRKRLRHLVTDFLSGKNRSPSADLV